MRTGDTPICLFQRLADYFCGKLRNRVLVGAKLEAHHPESQVNPLADDSWLLLQLVHVLRL
jgi:hypothetical protein